MRGIMQAGEGEKISSGKMENVHEDEHTEVAIAR